jgi:hypothetical protein
MKLRDLPAVQALGPARIQELESHVLTVGGNEIASYGLQGTYYSAAERGFVYITFPSQYSVDTALLPWVSVRVRLARAFDAQKDETTLSFDPPVGQLGSLTGNIFDQALGDLVAATLQRAGR